MKRNPSKQATKILSILLFSVGLMLSGNVFAADSTPNRVTQLEFNAAIANQATIDTAQQTALDKALDDIAKLQATIDKLTVPKIGDHFGGGIIFYVDVTGQHGLIASLSDQNNGATIQWYNGINKATGATGNGVGAGATNTAIIVAAQSNDTPGGNFAAKVAADFSVQEDGRTACTGSADEVCYGDWYLPSWHELNLMYHVGGHLEGFIYNAYWSSNEHSDGENGSYEAWVQEAGSGFIYFQDKSVASSVRAIRAY